MDKNICLIVVLLFAFLRIEAQEAYPDCTHPRLIELPLTDAIDSLTQNEIYYQVEDKYTYWYKLKATDDGQFSYQLRALNQEDEYELLIYRYRGGNFCNDLVNKKAKSIANGPNGTVNVKKEDVYYFGVLHLTGYGCGHQLTLKDKHKNATIKAVQNECIEEVMETLVNEKELLQKPTIDTVELQQKEEIVFEEEVTKEKNLVFKGWVVNSNTKENIDAILTVVPVAGGILEEVNAAASAGFELPHSKEKEMVVSIQKFGYERFQDTLTISSDTLIIPLNPIKVGQKLVMHKIYFHPNTYVLKQSSKQELEKLHQFMKENANYSFEIQGHTNGNKSIKKMQRYAHLGEEWNFKGTAKKLSKLRAEKIKSYLTQNGIDGTKLQTVGYGGDRMIISKPKNMKQAMQNIRVEVIVVQ